MYRLKVNLGAESEGGRLNGTVGVQFLSVSPIGHGWTADYDTEGVAICRPGQLGASHARKRLV